MMVDSKTTATLDDKKKRVSPTGWRAVNAVQGSTQTLPLHRWRALWTRPMER